MRVSGWHIDGFGVFADRSLRGLGPGLTVFHGANEAGKSTLLAFLRGVLFGFPDGRSRDPKYPPLAGGRHGGRVFLAGPEGEWAVDREAGRRRLARVTRPDGRESGEEDLRRLLGGADGALFKSIFAFSLTELQSFDSLTAGGVRERIFSAGIVGAGQSARQATKALDARTTELLRPRGQSRIASLASELDELRSRLAEAHRAAEGYDALLREERRLAEELGRVDAEAERGRAERARLGTLLELWSTWVDREALREQLEATPAVDSFPADGESRLAAARRAAEDAERSRAGVLRERDALGHRSRSLPVDDAVAAVADQTAELQNEVSLQRSRLGSMPGARKLVDQANEGVTASLRALGPDWTVERLHAFDHSIPRKTEVREWDERLRRLANQRREADRAHEEAAGRVEEIEESLRELLGDETEAEPMALDEIGARAAAVGRVRANLADLRALESEVKAQQGATADRDGALRALEAQRGWAPPVAGLVAAGVTSMGAGGGAYWQLGPLGNAAPEIGWGLAALSGAAGVATIVLALIRARVQSEVKRQSGSVAELRAQLESSRKSLQSSTAELDALRKSVSEDCARLDLPAAPAAQAIEALDQRLDREREQRVRWEATHSRVAEVQRALAAAKETEASRREARNAVRVASDEVQRQWVDWREGSGVSGALGPEAVLDFFEAVRSCREAAEALERTEAHLGQTAAEIESWERRARAVLEKAGAAPAGDGEALVEAVQATSRRATSDRDARREFAALERQIGNLTSKEQAIEAEREQALAEVARVHQEAGASDDASFRERLEAHRRRVELRGKLEELDRVIAARVGQGAEAQSLRGELAAGRVDAWRSQIAESDEALRTLKVRRDATVREHRDAESRRLEIEASADVARVDAERAAIETELAAAVRQWRVATLARDLIQDTLRQYERERQPAVLAQASEHFERVTRGRYRQVVQGQGGEEIAVIDAAGGRRRAEQLSRGTAEQLYLSIRLGLAAEFASRTEALPLIMDDVLVNFDPDRAAAMAAVLADFAEDHQILLFTCQPSTREAFSSLQRDVRIVEMEPIDPASLAMAADGEAVDLDDVDRLSPRDVEELLLEILSEEPLGLSELNDRSGVRMAELQRALTALRDDGRVEAVGRGRAAKWSLVE